MKNALYQCWKVEKTHTRACVRAPHLVCHCSALPQLTPYKKCPKPRYKAPKRNISSNECAYVYERLVFARVPANRTRKRLESAEGASEENWRLKGASRSKNVISQKYNVYRCVCDRLRLRASTEQVSRHIQCVVLACRPFLSCLGII